MLLDYTGACVGDIGPAPDLAQVWFRETAQAQHHVLPAVFTDPLCPPIPVETALPQGPLPVPEASPPALPPAPLARHTPLPRPTPVMLATNGSNITGGRGKQREQLLRRHGLKPTPAPVFDEVRQVAIITTLEAEGRRILTEVHHGDG